MQPQEPTTGRVPQPEAPQRPPLPRRHRVRRVVRGYLMTAGALATAYLLVMLLVQLFVEIGKWM